MATISIVSSFPGISEKNMDLWEILQVFLMMPFFKRKTFSSLTVLEDVLHTECGTSNSAQYIHKFEEKNICHKYTYEYKTSVLTETIILSKWCALKNKPVLPVHILKYVYVII